MNISWAILIFITGILLPAQVFASIISEDVHKDRIFNKTHRIQVPFIQNKVQLERYNDFASIYALILQCIAQRIRLFYRQDKWI